jgi:hypothetical protein
MMNSRARQAALAELPLQSCLAYAAICSGRALKKIQPFRKDALTDWPSLPRGCEMLWVRALNGDLVFDASVEEIHSAAQELIPESNEDEKDPLLAFTAKAICLGLLMLAAQDEKEVYAVNSGNSVINLVQNIYERWEAAGDLEEEWQTQAIQLLQQSQGALSRTMFDGIPEYDAGPLAEELSDSTS